MGKGEKIGYSYVLQMLARLQVLRIPQAQKPRRREETTWERGGYALYMRDMIKINFSQINGSFKTVN